MSNTAFLLKVYVSDTRLSFDYYLFFLSSDRLLFCSFMLSGISLINSIKPILLFSPIQSDNLCLLNAEFSTFTLIVITENILDSFLLQYFVLS